MKKLDVKFDGVIFKIKDNTIVSPDQYVVFLAKDNAFAAILPKYRDKCIELKCDKEQIDAVNAMIDGVMRWRDENQNMLKNPDIFNEKSFAQ